VNFNLAYIKTSNADFIGFSKVTLHEIFHVMGFSPPLYEMFVSPEGYQYEHDDVLTEYTNSVGAKSLGLKTPKLLAFAKEYYGCEDIQALPLENDGDAGSAGAHFERAVFFNEVMTASTIKDQVFSGFGFSLLADSGWYGISEEFFEDFQAGRGMGCDWFGSCHKEQNSQMFCKEEGAVGCNWDYTAVGICSDFFLTADQCRQIQPYDNFNCNVDDYSDMSRQLKEVTK
jgi:leishmanolysin